MSSTYTVEIQASDANREIWQAVHPAETIDTAGWGANWTAEDMARETASNQNVVEGGGWRICVWEGRDADTGTDPAYVLYAEDA